MLNWLKSRFAGPKPAGPAQVLRTFPPNQPTITQSGIGSRTAPGTLTLAQSSRLYDSLRWKIPPWSSAF